MKTKLRILQGLVVVMLLLGGVMNGMAQTSQTPTQSACPGFEPYIGSPENTANALSWTITPGTNGVEWTIIPGVDDWHIGVNWANPVAPTTYRLSFIEDNGTCQTTVFVDVTVNPKPLAPTVSLIQPTCALATGTITVTDPTGVGMTYSIDGVDYTNTTGVFTNVATGSYTVTAKNVSGCISDGTPVTINPQPTIPTAPTVTLIQPTCATATGTITITDPTGVGMTYSIDGVDYTNTTGIFTNVATGSYTVTAKNVDGCISLGTPVTIDAQPAAPDAPTVTLLQPTCAVATGTITVTAPIGVGMTYSIDGIDYTNTTGVFNTVAAGSYTVTAKSLAGCISVGTPVTINVQPSSPNTSGIFHN